MLSLVMFPSLPWLLGISEANVGGSLARAETLWPVFFILTLLLSPPVLLPLLSPLFPCLILKYCYKELFISDHILF